MTREELVEMVQKYSNDNTEFADGIERTYGWSIGKWNVSRIINFANGFDKQRLFNKDISEWNMSNATRFSFMFYRAFSFNQVLSTWNTSQITSMQGIFWSGCIQW